MDQYGLAASGERDGLWDWDLVSNRVHFSPRWISMVGCEDSEVGHSPEEWFGRVHAELDLLKTGIERPALPGQDQEAPSPGKASSDPMRRAPRLRIGRRGYAYAGLVAVTLLLSTGLPARFARETAAPVPARPLTAAASLADGALPTPTPEEAQPANPAAADTAETAASRPPAKGPAPAPKPRPATVGVTVEHQHVFGNCRGVLKVLPSGVSFTPDNGKDALALGHGHVRPILGGDTLTLKAGKDTYRFKSPDANGSARGRAQLQKVMTALQSFRPR